MERIVYSPIKRTCLSLLIALSCILSACSSSEKLTYFNDLPVDSSVQSELAKNASPTIQPGDVLGITVSSMDPVTNAMFNTGILDAQPGTPAGATQGTPEMDKQGYLVDPQGAIEFPVVGRLILGGKTLYQAHEMLKEEITRFTKEPIISIRYLNFKVTVIGEVNRPGTFTLQSDRVTVLEALGMAGDMTVYGKRNNVLLIREANGKRSMHRLDLNRKSLFSSPYFYLHQNDVVYVEPEAIKDPSGERTLRIITASAAVATAISLLVFRILN